MESRSASASYCLELDNWNCSQLDSIYVGDSSLCSTIFCDKINAAGTTVSTDIKGVFILFFIMVKFIAFKIFFGLFGRLYY